VSKINLDKTKVYTLALGMHHGYDIQDDDIWKSIVEKMKSYIHVWKRRNTPLH
jgi:hypothetical protein